MNRKTAFLIAAMSFAGLMTTGAQANEASPASGIQTMEPIVVTATFLPSASAVKLERIVVTAKRDLSDLQIERLARSDSKTMDNSVNGSASL